MRKFVTGFLACTVVYACYFFGLSYFGPSFYVGANAGLLFIILPIIALIVYALYAWLHQKKPLVAIGALCAFLLCQMMLQVALS